MKLSKSAANFPLKFIIFSLCVAVSALLLHFIFEKASINPSGKSQSVMESEEKLLSRRHIIIDAGHGASGKT